MFDVAIIETRRYVYCNRSTILHVLFNTLTQGYAVLPDTPVSNHVAIWTAGISGEYGNRITCTTS